MTKTNGSELQIQVYLEDTDATGVIYHASYVRFMERGRTHFMNQLNLPIEQFFELGFNFVVSKMQINFLQAGRFNQELHVVTSIKQLTKARIVFQQNILCEQQSLCQAEVVIACINAASGKPCAYPADVYMTLSDIFN